MQKLIELSKKEKKYVIGLMSGTSLDGTDAALVEITGNGVNTKLNLVGFIEHPFPQGLKQMILNNSMVETSRVDEISQLNFLISKIYVDGIKRLCEEVNFPLEKVDLIGSHGQTIHHLPNPAELFGFEIASTLQIADPSVIAKLTGVVTVGNFRTGDIALGGQGAPLVPYFDFILFHSSDLNRALLNIGGISNFTILNKERGMKEVLAFDTGPGNMIIDTLSKRMFKKDFDLNGEIAMSGKKNEDLFSALVTRDRFIEKQPPKSTGREYYGDSFLDPLFEEFNSVPGEDWLHTVTDFTAYGVFRNYEKFIKEQTSIDELIVSGGGAKNKFLYQCLHNYFGEDVQVKVIDEIGVSSDAKEAICFAVLANETISGNPSNIPRTTGASHSTVLGNICLP